MDKIKYNISSMLSKKLIFLLCLIPFLVVILLLYNYDLFGRTSEMPFVINHSQFLSPSLDNFKIVSDLHQENVFLTPDELTEAQLIYGLASSQRITISAEITGHKKQLKILGLRDNFENKSSGINDNFLNKKNINDIDTYEEDYDWIFDEFTQRPLLNSKLTPPSDVFFRFADIYGGNINLNAKSSENSIATLPTTLTTPIMYYPILTPPPNAPLYQPFFNNCTTLSIGSLVTSNGTFLINDVSDITVEDSAYIGDKGIGNLIQTGGTFDVKYLYIGRELGAVGYYNISGGKLSFDKCYIGLNGEAYFKIIALPILIDVRDYVCFNTQSYLESVLGAQITLDSATFDVKSTSPENLQLENLNLIFNDTDLNDGIENILEVACAEVIENYFDQNFAFNSIELNSMLYLIDNVDNQLNGEGNEVLYVRNLIFNENGEIDLGSTTLFYEKLFIGDTEVELEEVNGKYSNGRLVEITYPVVPTAMSVPEPSVFILSLFGFCVLKKFVVAHNKNCKD